MNNWAVKAARQILDTLEIHTECGDGMAGDYSIETSEEDIAAIIAKCAEPLVELTKESRREQ